LFADARAREVVFNIKEDDIFSVRVRLRLNFFARFFREACTREFMTTRFRLRVALGKADVDEQINTAVSKQHQVNKGSKRIIKSQYVTKLNFSKSHTARHSPASTVKTFSLVFFL
jgi:hypothetical protein